MFDFDGTLADTLPWMRSIFNELADEHGFRRVHPAEFEQFRNLHGAALLRALELPLRKLPGVMNSMRKRMSKHTGELNLFPGISEALHRLAAAGVQLAIVSSNSQSNVERVLGIVNARLIGHFACGVSMFGKAAKLRKVIRASGVPPLQALYIGDEIRDSEAARKAGVSFGAVSWGQHTVDSLSTENPDLVFDSPCQIADSLC
jgi:phosphoglycolate phosphatase